MIIEYQAFIVQARFRAAPDLLRCDLHCTCPSPIALFTHRLMLEEHIQNRQFDRELRFVEASVQVSIPCVICPSLTITVGVAKMEKRYCDFDLQSNIGERMEGHRIGIHTSRSRNVLGARGGVDRDPGFEAHVVTLLMVEETKKDVTMISSEALSQRE